jgi:hypothetical protein
MYTSPGLPLAVNSLTAAITDETIGVPADCRGRLGVAVEVTGVGTTSSGVITIEEAGTANYGGDWSPITTVNASDVDSDATKFIHLPVGAYAWVRTRVSTVIGGGGTVSTVIRGV